MPRWSTRESPVSTLLRTDVRWHHLKRSGMASTRLVRVSDRRPAVYLGIAAFPSVPLKILLYFSVSVRLSGQDRLL